MMSKVGVFIWIQIKVIVVSALGCGTRHAYMDESCTLFDERLVVRLLVY